MVRWWWWCAALRDTNRSSSPSMIFSGAPVASAAAYGHWPQSRASVAASNSPHSRAISLANLHVVDSTSTLDGAHCDGDPELEIARRDPILLHLQLLEQVQ